VNYRRKEGDEGDADRKQGRLGRVGRLLLTLWGPKVFHEKGRKGGKNVPGKKKKK